VQQQLRFYQDDNIPSKFESQLSVPATLDDSSTPIVKRTRVYRSSKPANVSNTRSSGAASGTAGQTAIQREILHTLQHRLNTKTRVNSNNYLEVKECYLCNKSKKSNSDNIWKLNVRPDGSYYCFRCSVGGNYEDFKMKINQYAADSFDLEGDCAVVANSSKNTHNNASPSTSKPLFDDCTDYFPDDNSSDNSSSGSSKPAALSSVSSSSSSSHAGVGDKYLLPMQRLANAYHLNLFPVSPSTSSDTVTVINVMHEQRQKVKVYLNEQRGLHDDILQKYQVGYTVQQFLNEQEEWKDQLCVTFPWILLADQVHQSHRFTSPPALQPLSSSSSGSSSKGNASGSGNGSVKAGYGKRGKQALGPNSTLSTASSYSSSNSGPHAFIEDPIKISFSHSISDEEKNKTIESSSSHSHSHSDNESDSQSHSQTSNLEEEYPVYIVRTKYRSLETKGLQRILPKGGAWGFFGWHTIHEAEIKAAAQAMKHTPSTRSTPSTPSTRSVIITEGEYDAMAVAQGLQVLPEQDRFKYIPVISLPNGCNSLPNELVSMLDRFDTIYLWMDYDKSGQEACEKFTRKLGLTRCLIVKPLIDRPVSE
jgi:hypothetical protein